MASIFGITDDYDIEMLEAVVSTKLHNSTFDNHIVPNVSLRKGCIPIRFNKSQYLPWDNPDNILKAEAYTYAAEVKNLLLAFCVLTGGPANVINMAVFYKQGLQDRVNLCLFMLAVTDLLYLTSSFILHSENIFLHMISEAVVTPANEFMANNNLIAFLGTAFVSLLLYAIIACERCYCVLRPLKYQNFMRTRTMAFIIASLFVCILPLFYLVSYRYWIGCVFDPVTGIVSMKMIGGGLYRTHRQFIVNLESSLFGLVIPGGAMVVVTITTIITAVKLRQIVTWRTETSSSLSSREVALTKMLIGNSVFFVICSSPSCAFRVAIFFLPEMSGTGRHYNFYFTTLCILEGVIFINSSFNFFIYYSMGSRFRETFQGLFKRKTHHKTPEK